MPAEPGFFRRCPELADLVNASHQLPAYVSRAPVAERDERSRLVRCGSQMPRYFFHVHDGVDRRDAVGSELPDLREARLEAVRVAGTILKDNAEQISSGEDWHLEVADQTGLVFYRIDVLATDSPVVRADPLLKS